MNSTNILEICKILRCHDFCGSSLSFLWKKLTVFSKSIKSIALPLLRWIQNRNSLLHSHSSTSQSAWGLCHANGPRWGNNAISTRRWRTFNCSQVCWIDVFSISLLSLNTHTHTYTLEPQELCLEMSHLILCRPPSFWAYLSMCLLSSCHATRSSTRIYCPLRSPWKQLHQRVNLSLSLSLSLTHTHTQQHQHTSLTLSDNVCACMNGQQRRRDD